MLTLSINATSKYWLVSMEWRRTSVMVCHFCWVIIIYHVRNEFSTLNDVFYYLKYCACGKHLAECYTQLYFRESFTLTSHWHRPKVSCFILFKCVNWTLLGLYYHNPYMYYMRLGPIGDQWKDRGVYRKSKGPVSFVLSPKDFAMKEWTRGSWKLGTVPSSLQVIHHEFWNRGRTIIY